MPVIAGHALVGDDHRHGPTRSAYSASRFSAGGPDGIADDLELLGEPRLQIACDGGEHGRVVVDRHDHRLRQPALLFLADRG